MIVAVATEDEGYPFYLGMVRDLSEGTSALSEGKNARFASIIWFSHAADGARARVRAT